MSRFRVIPFGCDLITEAADCIIEKGAENITVVFPGRRPSLYLKAHLAKRTKGKAFFPPACFSFEEFIEHIARRINPSSEEINGIDAIWLIFTLIKTLPAFDGHPFRARDFGEFLGWGAHLLHFIERLDREMVDNGALVHVERNAAIGYDVPPSVNDLLANISILREEFHAVLARNSYLTRGTIHLAAAQEAKNMAASEEGHILFAGIFGLTRTEKTIVRSFFEHDRADVIVSGDPEEWPLLKDLASHLAARPEYKQAGDLRDPVIYLHSGHDTHAEAIEAHRVLQDGRPARTAIVLPDPDSLFPVLNFVIDRIDKPYNISLGHPVDRTAVFGLVRHILDAAAETRPDGLCPADIYLKVMLHPFVKNVHPDSGLRRLLLYVERAVSGDTSDTCLAGRSAILPEDIEDMALTSGEEDIGPGQIEILKKIHTVFFRNFKSVTTMGSLAVNLESVLETILRSTEVRSYALSGPIFDSLFAALEVLKRTPFAKVRLSEDPVKNMRALHDIALDHLGATDLPFDTYPVEEIEVLGMLEARSISFERLIILDVNEGVLPGPRQLNPVVPLGVFETLGIPPPEFSEAIYRYNFYRLVHSAQEVHLVYRGTDDKPRSRYIEEIVWSEEKRQKRLNVMPVYTAIMPVNLKREISPPVIDKTGAVISALSIRGFSPSMLDTYVACPLLFYFTRLIGLEERQGYSTDIDASSRGDIIHNIMCDTFLPFVGTPLSRESVNDILESLHAALHKHLPEQYNSGEYYLFRKMARYKLESYLRGHLKQAPGPFIVRHLEEKLSSRFIAGDMPIMLSGKVDRIDCDPAGTQYTVIDYKTGSAAGQYPAHVLKKADFSDVASIHDHVPSFQLPAYMNMFSESREIPIENVRASLVLLGKNSEEQFFKEKEDNHPELIAAYTEGIGTVIADILNPEKPFTAFDTKRCMDCRARDMCHV